LSACCRLPSRPRPSRHLGLFWLWIITMLFLYIRYFNYIVINCFFFIVTFCLSLGYISNHWKNRGIYIFSQVTACTEETERDKELTRNELLQTMRSPITLDLVLSRWVGLVGVASLSFYLFSGSFVQLCDAERDSTLFCGGITCLCLCIQHYIWIVIVFLFAFPICRFAIYT